MDDKGNKYALAALMDKRASLASDIMQMERRLRHLRSSLVHVDATLRLLDPEADPEAIPTKRPTTRVKLFRQGELARMVRDALREANGEPIPAEQIVNHLMKVGGHDESARKALASRVKGTLAYLVRRDAIGRSGDRRTAKWFILTACG